MHGEALLVVKKTHPLDLGPRSQQRCQSLLSQLLCHVLACARQVQLLLLGNMIFKVDNVWELRRSSHLG